MKLCGGFLWFKLASICVLLSLISFNPAYSQTQQHNNDYLVKVFTGEYDELGVPCAYINPKGDTVVPMGKYFYCYTDTVYNYAIVLQKDDVKCIAIDKKDSKLYNVFWYDNGPDYIEEGLFRITDDEEKIGFADCISGKIIIHPQFEIAYPFKNGYSVVYVENKWGAIDKKGGFVVVPEYDDISDVEKYISKINN